MIDAHPAAAVCGNALGDAPFDLGTGELSTFTATGVRFDLLSRTAAGTYTLRATRG